MTRHGEIPGAADYSALRDQFLLRAVAPEVGGCECRRTMGMVSALPRVRASL
jgi:hypothetical protein